MGQKSRYKSGIRIRDENPGSYFREIRNNFKILKFFYADPDPGSRNLFDLGSGIRDGKNLDPGSGMEKIWIRDKHPGFATLA